MNKSNPLLQNWEFPPFDQIRVSDYLPAFEQAISEAEDELEKIASQQSPPDFENTILALDRFGQTYRLVSGLFFNLLEAEASEEMRQMAEKVIPMTVAFDNAYYSNEALFSRIATLYDRRPVLTLREEEMALLDKMYHAFVRHGACLKGADKERFHAIRQALEEKSLQYKNNVLSATAAFTLYFPQEELAALKGLPEAELEIAGERAVQKGKVDGYLFDLSLPSYTAFMKYVEDSGLRKQMYMAYNSRALGGEFDNTLLIKEIVNLRHEMAQMLGYATYADYVLEQRMLKTPQEVHAFLDRLIDAFRPLAERELAEIGKGCHPWDWSYLQNRYQAEKYHFDEQQLRPYLPLEKAKSAVFELARRLYGIRVREKKGVPLYHPQVEVYEVLSEKDDALGLLYMDFFPRESKRNGAWMTTFRDTSRDEAGNRVLPWVSLVFNFTPATQKQPSLLTFRELETLLHEFGHGLHALLSQVPFQTISGTSVARDFVELPSQIMENWAGKREFLQLFAFHYQTGEALPEAWISQLKEMENFCIGYYSMRQLNFGKLDMAWHGLDSSFDGEVESFENSVTEVTRTLPVVPHTNISTSFTHIFGGGYAAGYYGYKWAEVLSEDAFEAFAEGGLFSRNVASRFREEILSKGGAADPMELYVRFKGRKPRVEALLRRASQEVRAAEKAPASLESRKEQESPCALHGLRVVHPDIHPYLHQVKYYETDKMTVAHHSNYIRWMEEARVDLLDQIGFSYDKMEKMGVISPVIAVRCSYKYPCHFNDTVRIVTRMIRYSGVRFVMSYEMTDAQGGRLLATGETEHCFTDAKGRPVMIGCLYPEIDAVFRRLSAEQ